MNNLLKMSVFVTVGTTCFEALVETVCKEEIKQTLEELGYKELVIQYGKGTFVPDNIITPTFRTKSFRYKDSIIDDIAEASLVISHAGAGSCLEVLGAGKQLIVVINEKLMNNHQYELAKQLYKDNHLLYCTTKTLKDTIKCIHSAQLHPLPQAQTEKFASFMDNYLGFT